jgi:hypothetical protein
MKDDRLDLLLHALFEESLVESERAELNALLAQSAAARERYRRAAALHSALARRAAGPSFFEVPAAPVPAVIPFRRRLAAIAAVAVALVVPTVIFTTARTGGPVARVVEARGVVWAEGSPSPDSGRIPTAVAHELRQGLIRLAYPSGATVTLEGPCRFRLDEKEALSLLHGRASVLTPDGAQGFRVDTPGGRFVDLGTEFGLAVGSDGTAPVVLTEVFKGEVEIAETNTRLTDGQSRALVREKGVPKLLAALDESPVMLVNHNFHATSPGARAEGNLALGKPVFSPGYCTRPHGSVFPPDNLTDGRLDDSGVPGDWSFWLAPDGESGEFTVDLLRPERIGRISLQNTGNRGIGDRGTASFEVFGSLDNRTFIPLTRGELPRAEAPAGGSFPFHDFALPPTEARYVKVVVTGHYRHPDRPSDHPCQGGGLNEIRIFPE